jgi:hypothetical protein
MGLKATVVSINNQPILTYVADILIITWQMLRIAFEDFNMEFYIDNDFIIAVENED